MSSTLAWDILIQWNMKFNNSLKTLFLFNSIFVFAGNLLGPLYAIYLRSISPDITAVSISWAVYMFTATLGTIIVGKIGDKLQEKEYLLLAGYLCRAIGWFGFLFASSFQHVIMLQILIGIGEAAGTPAFEVIFSEHLDKGERVSEYATWRIISNLFVTAGILLGGWIVSYWGFPTIFAIMGSLAIISFLGILLKPRNLL